jgi:prepilin-type processing-associated H-X9-DG protein
MTENTEHSAAALRGGLSSSIPQHVGRGGASAFSARELLAVVAVVSLLVCVQLSALTGGSNQAKVAQCAANLKQYSLVVQFFGNDHNNQLPFNQYGNWPWDVSTSCIASMTNCGLTRQMMYCPGFPQQNIDQMWGGWSGYSATGYAVTFPTSPQNFNRLAADDANIALTTQRYTLNGSDPSLGPAGATVQIVPAHRVLLADATISNPNQTDPTQVANYRWTLHTETGNATWMTPYGPFKGSSTPHMGAVLPLGGNLGMLDGHVEWRPLSNMLVRSTQNSQGDVFWW